MNNKNNNNHNHNKDCVKFGSVKWLSSGGILEKYVTGKRKGVHMILLKMGPGKEIPLHKHTDTRYSYVLKGNISDQRGRYSKGDLVITRTGSVHSMKAGPRGCEFLVIWK